MQGKEQGHPHPRAVPRFPQNLSLGTIEEIFRDCVDFQSRQLFLHGDPQRRVTMCYILGMAKTERVNDYVLRPLAQDEMLSSCSEDKLFALLEHGALYNLSAQWRADTDSVVQDLIIGGCALFFPGKREVLTLMVPTEEKRSVGEPENEPALKGARDSFVESLRTNTSLVRRRMRAPELKIREQVVGRQSLTPVDVLWLDGIADPELVGRVEKRLEEIDIDGVEAAGALGAPAGRSV